MEINSLLKNLALDRWYKALMYIGVVLFVLSLVYEIKGISNGQLQLISSGLFFFGLGEWKHMKPVAWIKDANVYTGPAALVQTKVREPDGLSITFVITGVVLFLIGVSSIIWGAF